MKVGTWNVNGIRAREAQVLQWIERDRPDVICLQEIKASREKVPAALCEMPGYACAWHGGGGYSGVGLHVRREAFGGATPEFTHPPFDHENRIVTTRLGDVTFASVYVPNGGKDFGAKMRFLEALGDWAAGILRAGASLLVCGDLNVAREERDVHPKQRDERSIGQRPEERSLFGSILGVGLRDLGREFDPENDALFTWWAPWRDLRRRNIGWRLDYVLAGGPAAARAVSCPVLADFGTSDHAPVLATFQDS